METGVAAVHPGARHSDIVQELLQRHLRWQNILSHFWQVLEGSQPKTLCKALRMIHTPLPPRSVRFELYMWLGPWTPPHHQRGQTGGCSRGWFGANAQAPGHGTEFVEQHLLDCPHHSLPYKRNWPICTNACVQSKEQISWSGLAWRHQACWNQANTKWSLPAPGSSSRFPSAGLDRGEQPHYCIGRSTPALKWLLIASWFPASSSAIRRSIAARPARSRINSS